MEKVEKLESGCWKWTGASTAFGYGRIFLGRDAGIGQAHVAAYEAFVGPMPEGMLGCHKCDNPWCVNPEHIFPGTQAENLADMRAKGRDLEARKTRARGSQHGSAKLTEAQVRDIRARCAQGETQRALAREHGVSFGLIGHICRGRAWTHKEAA